jgi:hypothetical protein
MRETAGETSREEAGGISAWTFGISAVTAGLGTILTAGGQAGVDSRTIRRAIVVDGRVDREQHC